MSKCHCGLAEIPLGAAMFNYGGEVHAVTACTRSADWKARAEKAEAAIERVREVCEQTTVSVSIGCRCYTDECSGTCGAGRPLSWHLNPAAVLAALDGDSDE